MSEGLELVNDCEVVARGLFEMGVKIVIPDVWLII